MTARSLVEAEGAQLVEIPHGSEAYGETVVLRNAVLRRPLGLALGRAELEAEAEDTHLVCRVDGDLVGCLVLTSRGAPAAALRMRQVAVRPDLQGRGIGAKLVRFAEETARARARLEIVLHARAAVVPFYERLGYAPFGAPFEEVGIPHLAMRKRL